MMMKMMITSTLMKNMNNNDSDGDEKDEGDENGNEGDDDKRADDDEEGACDDDKDNEDDGVDSDKKVTVTQKFTVRALDLGMTCLRRSGCQGHKILINLSKSKP